MVSRPELGGLGHSWRSRVTGLFSDWSGGESLEAGTERTDWPGTDLVDRADQSEHSRARSCYYSL